MRAQLIQRINRRAIIVVFGLALLLSLVPSTTPMAKAETGQGIQVSPVIIDLNAEKGGDYTLKLTVTNVTAETLVLTSSVNDFRAADESGNPKVILDENADDSSYSAKTWVSSTPKITLKSKESRQVNLAVDVPSNAEAGGHYAVIRFSGTPPSGNNANVALTASVGVLLLARVNGDIKEQLVLKELFTEKNGKRGSIFPNGPLNIVARVENTGNIHVKPVGTLTVKDMFGKTVGSFPFGSNTKNVLPDSTRRYDQTFDKRWLFGRYTVQLQAGYGTTGAVLMGNASFWVIPFKLIFFGIVLLLLIFFGSKRLLRRYNKHVVHRSQNPKSKKH